MGKNTQYFHKWCKIVFIIYLIFVLIFIIFKKMPKKDSVHSYVRAALEKAGWEITHDPYMLENDTFSKRLMIDLGAEKTDLLEAEKGVERIAVEVKSFLGNSTIQDTYTAIGQFLMYQTSLQTQEADRKLYLAIPENIYEQMLTEQLYLLAFRKYHISLLIFHLQTEQIQWQEY
jgi:hypothetical protein